MSRSFVLWSMLLLAAACGDDDRKPESVPFNGLDPSVEPKTPDPLPAPAPTTSETTSDPSGTKPIPRPGQTTGRLTACCAALATEARSARDAGRRVNAEQASRVCSHQVIEVQRGKISVDSALARVRGSMLGSAPPSCR